MGVKNITFDDRDIERLRYSNNWFITGEWNASDVGPDLTGTLASSTNFTANVTFTFPQPANAFYYYGMKRSGGGLYFICIDCDPNDQHFTPIDALDPNDDGKQLPTLLFFKDFGDFGVHEILLTNSNDTRRNPAGTSQITIDRFEIQIQDDSIPSSSSATSSSSTSTIPFASPSPSSSSQSTATPVGAIAGGVIGGLGLIAVCAIILYCIRRSRNNTRRLKRDSEASAFPNTTPTPFSPHGLTTGDPQPTQSDSTYVATGAGGGKDKHRYIPTSTSGLTSPADISASTLSFNSSSASRSGRGAHHSGTSSSSGSRRHGRSGPRREVDAGRIMENESEYDDSETLPPDYNQVFRRGRSSRTASTQRLSRVQNPDDPNIDSGVSNAEAKSTLSQDTERRALPPIPQKT